MFGSYGVGKLLPIFIGTIIVLLAFRKIQLKSAFIFSMIFGVVYALHRLLISSVVFYGIVGGLVIVSLTVYGLYIADN